MKNGLFIEDGIPTYYEDDRPIHKGILKNGDDIYYIGSGGKAVKGKKFVHSSMTHDIVRHGTYQFGDDYKMVEGYYVPAKRKKSSLKKKVKKVFRPSPSSSKDNLTAFKIIVTIVLILLTIIGFNAAKRADRKSLKLKRDATESIGSVQLNVNVPEINDEVWLVTEDAQALYTEDADYSVLQRKYPYQPFYFEYYISFKDFSLRDEIHATLSLSEDESMENAVQYEADPVDSRLAIDNLKVDTTYYYRFNVTFQEEEHVCDGSFKTAASNRLLSLPDLSNVRDVGGRKNSDGKTVKQNLLIRGSELDGMYVNEFYLRDDYIDYARETFGFASDLDLRGKEIGYKGYKSRFGDDVKHEFFDTPMYSACMSESYYKSLRDIFSFLADESNYPIYMHCTHGVDRTGTIVFLLDAILGLSEDEIDLEYSLSNCDPDSLIPLKNAMEPFEGKTLNEKVESYLTDTVGVTQDEIESIRSIMLTD